MKLLFVVSLLLFFTFLSAKPIIDDQNTDDLSSEDQLFDRQPVDAQFPVVDLEEVEAEESNEQQLYSLLLENVEPDVESKIDPDILNDMINDPRAVPFPAEEIEKLKEAISGAHFGI